MNTGTKVSVTEATAVGERPQDEDTVLVARAQKQDLGAFEELVRRHQRPLFSYLFRMCGNPDEAEEMAQAAMVRAWQKLSGFQGRSSFKTWLYRIGTNLAINRIQRRKPTYELPETLPASETEEPEQAFRSRRREELVQAALQELPADQRSALVLCTYEDMSYQEIARSMGKTVRAVDSLLFRARQNLRKLLEPAREKGLL